MQHHQSPANFDQRLHLVLRTQKPLTLRLVAESMVSFVSDESESPKARIPLLHGICINWLHVGICSQLQSIHVIQLFGHGRVRSLVSLDADFASLVQSPHLHVLYLLYRQFGHNAFAHLE